MDKFQLGLMLVSAVGAIIVIAIVIIWFRTRKNKQVRAYRTSKENFDFLMGSERGRQILAERKFSLAEFERVKIDKKAADWKGQAIELEQRVAAWDEQVTKLRIDAEGKNSGSEENGTVEKTNSKFSKHGKESKFGWFTFLIVFPPITSYFVAALLAEVIFHFVPVASFSKILVYCLAVPFISFVLAIFSNPFRQIPQNNVWLVSVFGKYRFHLQAGFNFIPTYPLFPIVSITEIDLGDQRARLFMSDADKSTVFGDVQFLDVSSPVDAIIFYHFSSGDHPELNDGYSHGFERAAFRITNVKEAILVVCNGDVRSWLSQFKLDEANRLKSKATVKPVDEDQFLITTGEDGKGKKISPMVLEQETVETLFKWGVRVDRIEIADIPPPANIKEMRDQILKAEKEKEKAAIEAQTSDIRAEASRKRREKEGQGLSDEVRNLKNLGVGPEFALAQVTTLSTEEMRWTNLGDKAVIVEGRSNLSSVAAGAGFRAGFRNRQPQRSRT